MRAFSRQLSRVTNPAASYGALRGRTLPVEAELIFMLQLDVPPSWPSWFRQNVSHARLRSNDRQVGCDATSIYLCCNAMSMFL